MSGHVKLATILCVAFIASFSVASAQQQVIGAPPEASNMRLVGSNDLQARSAYQPTIHHQGDRWIAYIGHHGGTDAIPDPVNPLTGKAEPNGTSIVDVTNPANPRYLHHIPGQEGKYEGGGAQMVRICDGKTLPKGDPNAVYMLRTFGSEAHEIWNVADPANPVLITRLGGLKDTHKSWWECDTGIAFLVSGAPDWRTRRMTQVYDLSDPAHPQDPRLRPARPGAGLDRRGADRIARADLDRPARQPRLFRLRHRQGRHAADRRSRQTHQRAEGADAGQSALSGNLAAVMSAFNGAHTTFPMLKMPIAEFAHDKDGQSRDIVMIVDEAIQNECREPRQMVWFADVTVENRPMMISSYTVPEASGSFCERGGRFGSHSSNESMAQVYYKKMAFIAFFNAGVRLAIPITPGKSAISFPRSRLRPTSAASPSTARSVVKWRSRPTMSKPTIAATSTSSIAPIPACIFWS